MPKKLPDDLVARIEGQLAQHPGGLGIDALHTALAGTISRRTLQRRLAILLVQRRVTAAGKGRALKYRQATDARAGQPAGTPASAYAGNNAPARPDVAAQPPMEYLSGEFQVPTSVEGEAIRAYLRQPIQRRDPVGYDRGLLENYRPGITGYLSAEIREHLHAIGRSPNGERPAGTYARDILGRLLIDLSWASSRLEGNTYTRLDTQNLIELGQAASGKDRREAQMILNHKAAIELLVEQADEIGFNTFTFFNLHALLSDGLLVDPNEGGRLRRRIVEVSGTVFHPLGIPPQIDAYFRMTLEKAEAIDDPFEQAFFIMVHIPYLQPFVDVNKRVSRLGANIPLIRHNLCPLSFIDVPERAYVEGTLGVYELKQVDLLRDVFVWAYERSCRRYMAVRETVAEPDPTRLRYREAIIAIVSSIVRSRQPASTEMAMRLATQQVPHEVVDAVVERAMADLRGLHEGNVARYRLRLSEYRAWQPMQG